MAITSTKPNTTSVVCPASWRVGQTTLRTSRQESLVKPINSLPAGEIARPLPRRSIRLQARLCALTRLDYSAYKSQRFQAGQGAPPIQALLCRLLFGLPRKRKDSPKIGSFLSHSVRAPKERARSDTEQTTEKCSGAGAEGIEPPTFGFGDRCSAS